MEGMPSSLDDYTTSNSTQHNQKSSSSKLPIAEKKMRIESRRIMSNPTQTLDQFQQFYAQQHQIQEAVREPNPDLNPVLQLTSTPAAGASNSNLPPLQPLPAEAESGNGSPIRCQYRECQKNHAASSGGHVVDGCGEFMPNGEEGTPEALKCAACECHRSFHRREVEGDVESRQLMTTMHSYYSHNPNGVNTNRSTNNHIQVPHSAHHLHHHRRRFPSHYSHNLATPNSGPMMMAFGSRGTAESSSEDLNTFRSGGQHVMVPPNLFSGSKKRFRTKFTREQKDRMHEVAEKLGWKIQKQDEDQVRQLCQELEIKKQVFKVWMHNNKQVMKKKQQDQ